MKKIVIDIFTSLDFILQQLDNEGYIQPLPIFNGNTIGQHSRHIIEFFQCLMKSTTNGIVNYDARVRSPLLESDVFYAQEALISIKNYLENNYFDNVELSLKSEFGISQEVIVSTNFNREMIYLIEHSVHHFALLRIGLQENFQEIQLPENFGIAYSTVKFMNENK